jgi:hypothetical protein
MPSDASSATQKDAHPVTEKLSTGMVPFTPLLGSADESVDSAPTHQTLLPELDVAAKMVETGVAVGEVERCGGEATTRKAARKIGTMASESSFTRLPRVLPLIYPRRTPIMDSRFVSVSRSLESFPRK